MSTTNSRSGQALRQPYQRISLSLTCPPSINLAMIDDWLENAMAINVASCRMQEPAPGFSPNAPVAQMIWRCLLLNSTLLQFANVPAFDPGRVLSIKKEEGGNSRWTASLLLVNIDQIPQDCFNRTLDASIHFIQWCSREARTPTNTDTLYAAIEKRVKTPLQRLVFAGKSTIPVLRTAHRLNIPFIHLGAGVYQLGWGARSRYMDRSTTDADSAIGSKLSQNKVFSANLIHMAGLPGPTHEVVSNIESAQSAAQRLSWPLVVKPADRDRGEGVTVDVSNSKQLISAFDVAHKLSKSRQVIIERQVPGVCHRLFIFNGKLLYAVKRLPKSIQGNGENSVAELIAQANHLEELAPPWLKTEPFPNDDSAIRAMNKAGFSLDSIPKDGELIPLRNIESTEYGGYDEDVTHCIHPENLAVALRATTLFGLDVVGVDIISSDIGTPWYKNGAIINEVNFAPLFGGAAISRSNIPEFFRRLLREDGRIPVVVFVGMQTAMAKATEHHRMLINEGTKCFLSSNQTTLNSAGQEMALPFRSLYKRCRALLLNRDVEAIVLVVQTDEFLQTGLPIDRISKLVVTEEAISSGDTTASATRTNKLASALERCIW